MALYLDNDSDDGHYYDCSDDDSDASIELGIESLMRGLNVGPKKKLLVMHLDGLVAHSFFPYGRFPAPAHRLPDGRRGRKLGWSSVFFFKLYLLILFEITRYVCA